MIGKTVGPYQILDKLGEGGMGEVYRARDARLNRDVAIKILPPLFASDPDRVSRFTREAQTLAALNHPHIAQIYGIEESAGSGALVPMRALVMELVPGDTLADRIARGPLPIDDALPIARQIADALEAAHGAGIVHRDLKPANIKLRPDGTVKVLDFGLAKSLDTPGLKAGPTDVLDANSPTVVGPTFRSGATQMGIILGTAAYMSPEQARGKAVDQRADIWAFGCVLYEMLTGRSPFHGETVTDVIASVVKNEPDWTRLPPGTPANVRRTIERCLRKDPQLRLRDIGDARLELSEADRPEPSAPPPRGRSLWPAVALTAIVALVAGAAIGVRWPRPQADTRAPRWSGVRLAAPAAAMNPVLSPDGQMLAIQTLVDGQSQIAVMNPNAGTWRVLTTDRTRGLTAVHDWSPDGSRIFFDRHTDSPVGIFAVPSLGGEERLLLEDAGYPTALPNGDLLVIRVNAARQPQLHRFSPSAGRLDPLPLIADVSESDDAVVASADGRKAYVFGQPLATAGEASAFFEIDLETRRTAPVDVGVSLRAPVSLGLQRNTGDILFGGLDGDAFQLMRISAQPGVPPRPVLAVPGAARFDTDRQGRIYLNMRIREPQLYAFPRVGSQTTPVKVVQSTSLNTRRTKVMAPLADGSVLVGARTADRDHILVVKPGGTLSRLVDGDEETRPPATAVGAERAAVMMGPLTAPDIAIVNTADGRLVRRFKAPSATMTAVGTTPGGGTLYYADAGSIWSILAEGGAPTKIGPGDSFTVEPETGDLIVKLDEGARFRLVRMKPRDGAVEPIPVKGDLRLIARDLVPGAVRQGRLAFSVASADSWFWQAAVLDLRTGVVTKLVETNPSDFHFVTWRADGVPIGFAFGLETTLWRFTANEQ